jgi:hypothetical protein
MTSAVASAIRGELRHEAGDEVGEAACVADVSLYWKISLNWRLIAGPAVFRPA